MKFDITIKDATLEEFLNLQNKLGAVTVAPIPAMDEPETETETETDSDGEGVDADGLPWDERIHSSSKKKTAKGVWVRRRGLQDAEYEEVKAEITGAEPVAQPLPQAPQVCLPPEATPPLMPASNNTLQSVLTRIQGAVTKGMLQTNPRFVMDMIANINATYGTDLKSPTDLAGQEHLIAQAHAFLDQAGA